MDSNSKELLCGIEGAYKGEEDGAKGREEEGGERIESCIQRKENGKSAAVPTVVILDQPTHCRGKECCTASAAG